MAGKITLEQLAEKNVFEIGQLIAKGLEPATPAVKKFVDNYKKQFAEVKQIALEFNKLEKSYKVAPDRKTFNQLLQQEAGLTEQVLALKKEQDRLEKALISAIAKKNLAYESTNRALIKQRYELQKNNKLIKEETILNSKNSTFLEKITVKRTRAVRVIQDLNAKKALGIKLSNKEQKELKQSTKAYLKYNSAIKVAKTSTGQFQENVGNYPKTVGVAVSSFSKLLPIIGAGFGLREAWNFTSEMYATAKEAKGVEFAFKRLGVEGEEALEKVRKSTRGLLSDLDIKRSLVEFDNFNLSLEETNTLFEFLAVRATQTGRSVDSLKDSLVEGLSKKSKLRIDNLGISASELNEELEKTPDFVQAVANIAKREIAEAGDILDETADSQQRFNAELENFKIIAGSGFLRSVVDSFYDLGTNVLRLINPTKELTNETKKERDSLNLLITSIITTNDNEEKRSELLDELSEKYPFFLKFLKEEKTDNDSLKNSLSKVNDMYIKRLALQSVQEKLEKKQFKEADATQELAQRQRIYAKRLAEVNQKLFKGNTQNIKDNLSDTSEAIKKEIEKNILRLSRLGSSATDIQKRNLKTYQSGLDYIREIEKSIIGSNYDLDLAKDATNAVKKEIEELEKILGLTSEQINDFFSLNEVEIKGKKLSDKQRKEAEARRQQEAEDAFNLQKLRFERVIKFNEDVVNNEKQSYSDRIRYNKFFVDSSIALFEFEATEAKKKYKGRADKIKEIELQLELDKESIRKQGQANAEKILQDAFNTEKKIIQNKKALNEQGLQDELTNAQDVFNIEIKNQELTIQEKERLIEAHEKRIADIKRKYAEENLKTQIALIQKELNNENYTAEQKAVLSKMLSDTKKALSDLNTNHIIDNLEKQKEQERKIQEFKTEQIKIASSVIAESLNLDSANLERFFTGFVDGFENALDGMSATASVVGDIMNSIYQSNIDAIDYQIEKSQEYYNRQYELAEGDKIQQDLIRKDQEKERKKLEKKKREEERKAAIFNKVLGVTQIGINLAKNISAINLAAAMIDSVTFGIGGTPYRATNIPIAVASAALQVGSILAKPIPKYKMGRSGGKAELAIVGDGGVNEVIERKKGGYEITPKKDTLTWLDEGDKVHRNIEAFALAKGYDRDFYDSLYKATVLGNLSAQNARVKHHQQTQVFNNTFNDTLLKELISETKRNTEVNRRNKPFQPKETRSIDIEHQIFRNENLNW